MLRRGLQRLGQLHLFGAERVERGGVERGIGLIEQDDAKRVEMYKELQQRVYDNYNVIPLFHNSFAYAYTNSVQGLAVDTFSNYYCENIYKAE